MAVRLKTWSEGAAVRQSLNRLDKIDALLIEIGGLWGDEDQSHVDHADSIRAEIDEFRNNLKSHIEQRRMERENARYA